MATGQNLKSKPDEKDIELLDYSNAINQLNVIAKEDRVKKDNLFIPSFMKSIDEIRTARYDRLFLKDSHISKIKYALLFVFGI